ncbi:glycerol-3-phosphate acyltransferase 2, mitochondrial isoform X4 [Pongo abelii]|uniref:glycerol-3-phosphate acyltransferase 2, mitochondrial isoform X4 n=1 Tax=Pongo abelii TaxID=9601 RepID=UPI0023E7DD72|nr:glycerol-3-phosphate acyltransferase 2, mitochondrial isoform X4 [Pongo abelii]
MATMLEGRCQTQPRSSPSGRETSLWSSGFGMKLEAVTPFLGKYRPFVGRCCQTCTPKSWESLFHRSITDLGFCNVILVKEENTRFRGWLVRRLCYFLWSLEQHIPPCQDAPQKIMESTRVQNLLSGRVPGGTGEGQVPDLVKKEVQRILGHTQAPPRPFLVRLFSWALLRFLNCLFLNVQLHKGQMKMVQKAAQAASAPLGLWTGALAVLRSLWSHWGCSRRICSRVHLAQPFSLQEYIVSARSCWGGRQTLEQLLQPIVLGQCTAVPDTEKEQEWTPITGPLLALKEEDQLLVRRLSCHVLSASVGSSAVMSTAIMATLLLVKHQKGVFLSQLLGEFSWLTEEILLRGFDVGFSGQLRSLLQHSLSLLRAHVALLRIRQGDLLVVPRPGPGLTHLAQLSAELLPVFLSEAMGACAVRGLLAGRVPPQGPWELQGILLLSQNELYRQILLLMHLLPQDLLLLKPCQSSYCYCQEVLDRLIQCGLLVAEETPGSRPACDTGRQRLSRKLLWKPSGDFTDSDSDDFEEAEGRYFRLSQQSHCPDFFLFLCRLLSPLLKAFAQAAAFLRRGQLPDTESGYTEQLFQFLQATAQEEGIFECADPKLAISAIWTFRDLGVLQQTPSPAGPRLHLSPTFASRDNQEKLEQFIRQFICS